LYKIRIFICPHWYIKFSTRIHSMKSIETSPIEVDKSPRSFNFWVFFESICFSIPSPNFGITLFCEFKSFEKIYKFLRMGLDNLIRIYQFFIYIGQKRLFFLDIEKNRSSSDKWFKVIVVIFWEKKLELFDELSFSSHPFYKRCCLNIGKIFVKKLNSRRFVPKRSGFNPRLNHKIGKSKTVRERLYSLSSHKWFLEVYRIVVIFEKKQWFVFVITKIYKNCEKCKIALRSQNKSHYYWFWSKKNLIFPLPLPHKQPEY